jgi:hypothetical protein
MDNNRKTVKLVVYKIKPQFSEKYVSEIIELFRKEVMLFEGFISFAFFQGCIDKYTFMDFVFWDSLENAESASEKVKHIQQNENFKEYINAFEKVEIFTDFNLLNMWNNNSSK